VTEGVQILPGIYQKTVKPLTSITTGAERGKGAGYERIEYSRAQHFHSTDPMQASLTFRRLFPCFFRLEKKILA